MSIKGLRKNFTLPVGFPSREGGRLLKILAAFFEHEQARGLSPDTLVLTRNDAGHFLAWMAERKIYGLRELGAGHIEEFNLWLAKREGQAPGKPLKRLSAGTRAHILIKLRLFLRWCYRSGQTGSDLSKEVVLPRLPQTLPRSIPTLGEIARLIRTQRGRHDAEGRLNAAVIAILFASGLRRLEVAALQAGDVDFGRREVLVRRGKGGEGRIVPIAPWAVEVLQEYRKNLGEGLKSPAFFVSPHGRPLTRHRVDLMMVQASRQAGLERPIKPHDLRHAFCLALFKGGAKIRQVNALAGHKTLSVTSRYTRLNANDLAEILHKTHPLGGGRR